MFTPSREVNHAEERDTRRDTGPVDHRTVSPARTRYDPYAARAHWPWDAPHTLTVAVLWVIGVALLALLSFAARHAGPFPGDVSIEKWVQQLHQPALVRFINFASDANWPYPAGITAIAIIVLLALARQIRAAISAALAGFGADFVNVTLNGIVKRPRPYGNQIHAVAHLGLYTFPSGHVTHVLAFWGFLFYLTVIAYGAHPRWRPLMWLVRVVALYFIIFIGPSRVLEGEHWPSDVLASYLLGALMLVVGIVVFHLLGMAWARFRERQSNRTSDHGHMATA
ncbi:MAG TPA: phosphatase PAP2 family protein [Ktedonobacterales bacterium]|nr:phosphatase PAP2 family protein [Ktedonobacterales bacterium]